MTYAGAIEYNENIVFTCREIDIEITNTYYKCYAPKGYNHDSYQKEGYTPIANITAAPSFTAVYNMFDCKKYDIVVDNADNPWTGKVIYARERYPTITQ